MNNRHGFSLIELLIALLLVSISLLILMRHYLDIKQQYRHIQTALERNMELQFVSELIRSSSRRAGFTPCLGIEHLTTVDQRQSRKKLVAIAIDQNNESWVSMNRMSDHFETVLHIIDETHLITTALERLNNDQSILIADCYHAEVQKIQHVRHMDGEQILSLSNVLAFNYHEPIYVGLWLEESYFIRAHPGHQGTLFYQQKHAEELTEHVHTLSAKVYRHNNSSLLQIILGLDNQQKMKLETMVRTW